MRRLAWLSVALAACSSAAPSAEPPPPSPNVAPPSTAPRLPSGAFVRGCAHETSVDECACLGAGGYQCGNAFRDEKSPVVRRFMLRMVEAEARRRRDDFARNWYAAGESPGVPHAEAAMFCKESGPCGGKNADGNDMDGGYACLTGADGAYIGRDAASRAGGLAAVDRACRCDLANARVPVMGGYGLLACDENGKPKEFGLAMELELATEVRACAECDAETGRKACQAEIDRLWRVDEELARFVAEVHAPRCRRAAK